MAIGSRRVTPTAPVAAAVVSELIVAARYTPCAHSRAWKASGVMRDERPPKTKAEMGTPRGSSQRGEMVGHCRAGAVKRALGWAALPLLGVHGFPCQSSSPAGGSVPMPSHQG